jgi:hypothetical protein
MGGFLQVDDGGRRIPQQSAGAALFKGFVRMRARDKPRPAKFARSINSFNHP